MPLILSFSRSNSPGEFAIEGDRIRERMRLGEGTPVPPSQPAPLPSASACGCSIMECNLAKARLRGRGLGRGGLSEQLSAHDETGIAADPHTLDAAARDLDFELDLARASHLNSLLDDEF